MSIGVIDHYEVLGVSPDADVKTIRAAYFALAKTYHPDRQVEQSAENTERFLAVQTAYEVLSRPRSRGEYDQERERMRSHNVTRSRRADDAEAPRPPADSGPKPRTGSRRPTLDELKDARTAFMRAESLMGEGKHEAALKIMRAVVRTVRDNPEYLSLAGYLQALVGANSLHEARDLCQMAVEAEPYNAEFLARLGYVYQEVGLSNRAEEYYEQALSKDPRQAIARAHLPRVRPSSGGVLGIVGRLLGN